MRTHLLSATTSLLVLIFAGACATGDDDRREEREQQRPADCVEQDFSGINSSVQTCVRDFGPRTLPDEMQMRQPHAVTTLRTPQGRISNPLSWSVEVTRDGEFVVEREFGEDDTVVEEGEEAAEIQSVVPLEDGEEVEPGVYEFRYEQEDEGEVGTTTIEVAPMPGEDTDQEETDGEDGGDEDGGGDD